METKAIMKRAAVALMAAALIFGSVPSTAEAKGTAFISKKVSTITPKVTSFKRVAANKATVKVTIPASKVKKMGTVKKVTVAYGSQKGKKFEAIRTTVKVKKLNKTTYTFDLKAKNLVSFKNTFVTCQFAGKSNWSAMKTLSNKGFKYTKVTKPGKKVPWYIDKCNQCGKVFDKYPDYQSNLKDADADREANYPNGCLHLGGTMIVEMRPSSTTTTYQWVK